MRASILLAIICLVCVLVVVMQSTESPRLIHTADAPTFEKSGIDPPEYVDGAPAPTEGTEYYDLDPDYVRSRERIGCTRRPALRVHSLPAGDCEYIDAAGNIYKEPCALAGSAAAARI